MSTSRERECGVEHRLGGRASGSSRRRRGAGTARFAASSTTSAPRRRASSASATPMRPDERLPTKRAASSGSRVPPAVTSTRFPARLPGASSCATRRSDLGGLGHPPDPPLALGRLALVGPDELDAARDERLGVRAGGGVRPHARVHRGRDEHRPAVSERRLGEQVVGDPVRELRERVRRAGRDDEQVGAGRGAGRGPRSPGRRASAWKVSARDEPLGARGEERDHLVAAP